MIVVIWKFLDQHSDQLFEPVAKVTAALQVGVLLSGLFSYGSILVRHQRPPWE